MLDKLRKAVAPATITAEIIEIEGKLVPIDAEREDRRLLAGRLVQAQGAGNDGSSDREIRQHRARIAALDEMRSDLRDRRRVLLELLKPEPEARKALVDIPMSDELVAVVDRLAVARAERQTLISERHADDSEAKERKRAARIGEIEDNIRTLRAQRAELLVPYNAAMLEALAPYIRKSARKLLDASRTMREALRELGEIGQMAPASALGQSSGFEIVGQIATTPMFKAEDWAEGLMRANPEIPE